MKQFQQKVEGAEVFTFTMGVLICYGIFMYLVNYMDWQELSTRNHLTINVQFNLVQKIALNISRQPDILGYLGLAYAFFGFTALFIRRLIYIILAIAFFQFCLFFIFASLYNFFWTYLIIPLLVIYAYRDIDLN